MGEGGGRLFVGVPVEPPARTACAALVDRVRADAPVRGIRWVPLERFHLTLRFLGFVGPGSAERAAGALAATAAATAPFEVVLAGGGGFPEEGRRPRALWLGVGRGAAELARLATALDDALGAAGFVVERRTLRPHVTVARTDAAGAAAPAVAAALAATAAGWSTAFRADRVVLYRSVPGADGARYEPIAEEPFRG